MEGLRRRAQTAALLGLLGGALSLLSQQAVAVVTADGAMQPMPSLPTPDLSGVGRLSNGCSAVLLRGVQGNIHLLGAAHCHVGSGGGVTFASGARGEVIEAKLAPDWAGVPGANDLALMTLAAAPEGVEGYAIAPAGAVRLPCLVLVAGWGAGGTGLTGADTAAAPAGTLRYGYNEYEALLPPIETYGNRVAMFDFDDGSAALNRVGRKGLAEYEAMLASLDSGGPSFVAVAGRWMIAGIHAGIVTSHGTGFGGVGLDVQVAPYARWIASKTTALP